MSSSTATSTRVNKLIVQLSMSEDTDFDQLIQIEETLIQALLKGRLASVDGHDIGEDRFKIFIHLADNWEPVLSRVTAVLGGLGVLADAVIAKFYGDTEKYEVVYPVSFSGTFAL
jgi:hypothetical protein